MLNNKNHSVTSLMNQPIAQSILKGNIEALNQGIRLLTVLSDEQYRHIPAPYVKSSIGEHFRHVADMFAAVCRAADEGIINYDRRRRGALVETQRQVALAEFEEVKAWMESLDNGAFEANASVVIQTEITLEETESVRLKSSFLRELVFTSSHAVHHFALISVIAKLQGVDLVESFGVAPATATYLRSSVQEPADA